MIRDRCFQTVGPGPRAGIFAVIVGVASLLAADVDAQQSVAGEFDRLVDLVEQADTDRAAGLAAAHMVGELRPYMVPEDYARQLQQAADAVDEPLVDYVVRRRAARADLERGAKTEDDSEFAGDESCLVDWELVGPFNNDSMQGFRQSLPPELGEEGPYEGRMTDIDWRRLDSGHHLCVYQLNNRVHPSTSAVAYLATTVEVDEPQTARLLVGSKSAYRVWVDGRPVGQRTDEPGLGVDAEGWDVELETGENEILVKLASSGQGGLSWTARLVDEDDRPLEGYRVRPGIDRGEVQGFEPVGPPDGGGRTVVEEGVEAESPSTRLAAAVLWQRLYSDDSATPWRDVARELEEEETDELTGRELVWLARLFEQRWERRTIFDEAAARAGDDPFVARAGADDRADSPTRLDQRERRRRLEELVEDHPDFLMAVESLARWYRRHEGAERALRTIETWEFDDRERVPAWVRLAADLHENAGDARRADQLRRATANVHRLSGTFGLRLVRQALVEGDRDEALNKVEDYVEATPWSTTWRLREAMLLRASDQIEEALAVVDALIDEAPGNARLHQRRAELKLAAGDRESAMASLQDAITHRPQATRYQKHLEHLQPESTRFYEPWRITELREIAERVGDRPHDWDRLVDQTIHQVASNGLTSEYTQRADRVLDDDGINSARRTRITFTPGDERVEVLGVRVHKEDGTIAEDYDQWQTDRTRQGARKYNDRAYLHLRANNVDVGDIVEFRYVVHDVANENFRGDYFGDVSYVQSIRPVAKSRYVVHYPEDWELHFRAPELPHERFDDELPDGRTVDDQRVTAFEMSDLPRVRTEDDQPGNTEIYDHVLVSNKATFDDVGTWWWELIEEQMVVDDAIARTVRQVTEGLETDAEKLEAIHNYVVDNTRYLHVGLGIHGWKPYRTSTVFRNQYGDCKDKSALLKVMLEEAGIETHMVLVRTRRLGTVEGDPPSMNIFNHAVVYVPSKELFIDPTARYNGPRELTQMNHGANALIIKDGGDAEWVTMPVDDPKDNLIRRILQVDYTEETPLLDGFVEAHGNAAASNRRRFEDEERRDEDFEDRLRSTYSGLSLLEARYENLDRLGAPSKIDYTAEVPSALRGGADNTSIVPLVETRDLLDRYARSATRHQDLTFRIPYTRQAEVVHRLPEDKTVERLPGSTELDSPFGHLEIDYEYEDGELTVDASWGFEVQRVDVEDYPEFRRFVTEMDEALNERIRLAEIDDA